MLSNLRASLEQRGFFFVEEGVSREQLQLLIDRLGAVISSERIALREGAHAYVAKPGRVPLHTDHPEVDLIAWHCIEQDLDDGASWLLDGLPVLEAMQREAKPHFERLFDTRLECPPLQGGPPTRSYPVLREAQGRWRLFCSPWLRAVDASDGRGDALGALRVRLSDAAKHQLVRLRMKPGGVIIVDNGRVLHGRGAIAAQSRRWLERVWIARW
jgi:hypothetical protein